MGQLWEHLAPDAIKQIILKPGGAFQMRYQYGNEGEKRRYFFVLNKRPEQDDRIVLLSPTTQIKKRRTCRRRCPEVLVEISPRECSALEERSVVDCASKPIILDKKKLIEKVGRYEVQPLSPLSDSLLVCIHKAIASAKTWDAETKRLVLGEEAI